MRQSKQSIFIVGLGYELCCNICLHPVKEMMFTLGRSMLLPSSSLKTKALKFSKRVINLGNFTFIMLVLESRDL